MNTETTKENSIKFLAQNLADEEISDSDMIDSLEEQDEIDESILISRNDKTFQQCSNIGNSYSEKELNEDLQELNG
ncbi:hypothetical protein J6T66_04385 [bacterium]|nr:hypothetical protein [bacterium]